jgi:hypothetical protein
MKTNCVTCGKEFEPAGNWNRKRKNAACGQECRNIQKTIRRAELRFEQRQAKRKKTLTPAKGKGKVKTLTAVRQPVAKRDAKAPKKPAPRRTLGAELVW